MQSTSVLCFLSFGMLCVALTHVAGVPFGYYRLFDKSPALADGDLDLTGDLRNLGYDNGPADTLSAEKRFSLEDYPYGVKRNVARLPKVDMGFGRGHSGARLASYGAALLDTESPSGPGRRRRSAE
ncbi:uncharacterized protein LOC129599646 [Paramacrobiotus metropolitanus]|uniref:uncharacterized protein LOC129599646 n=1 Tax=Paramacrobiotus metropolitanus TaxID=2943436 RepID=UPI0024465588|nr:uncharacterized protein LOC129599646 [Paramacrobiotus metropolitanus]